MLKNKIAIIVDGFRIAACYAPRLIARGYDCVHVQSSTRFTSETLASYNAQNYLKNIINYNNDIDAIIEQLKPYANIEFVIAGIESGVELTTAISEKLHLPGNSTKYCEAFRDKYLMNKVIAAAGLRTAKQILSNDINEILLWIRNECTFPVVVKPTKSAATELVTISYNEKEVEQSFAKIIGNYNFLGLKNHEVLVQSFLRGTEFIVNGINYAGKHFLSEMWQYNKIINNSGSPLYDRFTLLPYSFEHREAFKNYIFQVLDALKMNYGAFHAELILTEEGPVLVEVAARAAGSIYPEIITLAIGRNQYDMLLDCYINPEKFVQEYQEPWVIKKNLSAKLFISYSDGILKSIDYLDAIKKLPSFHKLDMYINVGERIHPTIDLIGIPGTVFLLHEDENVVQKDYETICELEKTMFVV